MTKISLQRFSKETIKIFLCNFCEKVELNMKKHILCKTNFENFNKEIRKRKFFCDFFNTHVFEEGCHD